MERGNDMFGTAEGWKPIRDYGKAHTCMVVPKRAGLKTFVSFASAPHSTQPHAVPAPATLAPMPLKKPSRLPKHLNRPASPLVRSMAKKYYGATATRRRMRTLAHGTRKWSKVAAAVGSEFKVWAGIATGLCLVVGIGIVLFSPLFDVKQIQVRRQDARLDVEEVQQVLSPLFHTRLPLVTKAQVLALLQQQYPDIRRVEIAKQYPSTLVISAYLDTVVAELSLEQPMYGSGATSGSGSYAYLTAEGYTVFSPMKLNDSGKLPLLRVVDWGVKPADRTFLVSPEFLQTVFQARDMLAQNFGFTVSETTMYIRAQEFHIKANKVSLWFDIASPLALQFQRFRDFLKTVPLEQVKDYIDLRISDRVIYK